LNTQPCRRIRAVEVVGENGVTGNGRPRWDRARLDDHIAAAGLIVQDVQGDGNCAMRFDCVRVTHIVCLSIEN